MKNNTRTTYFFSRRDASLLDLSIVVHLLLFWVFAGVIIYCGYCNNNGIPLILIWILAIWYVVYFSGFRFLYYRWLMLKYDDKTTLTIDTTNKSFTYIRSDKTIFFTSDDIKKWWIYETGPGLAKFVEIIEISLKDGENIIISSGVGDAVYFIYSHRKELELPEEQLTMDKQEQSTFFKSYIKEIKSMME